MSALSHAAQETLAALYRLELEKGDVITVAEIQSEVGDGPVVWAAVAELHDASLIWRVDCEEGGQSVTCYGVLDKALGQALQRHGAPSPRSRPSSLAEHSPTRMSAASALSSKLR